MKNISYANIVTTIFFVGLLCLAFKGKSQATCNGYQISNGLLGVCPINVSYTIICTNPTGACSQSGSATINVGTPFNVPTCGGGCNSCDIRVTLTSVNGSTAGLPVSVRATSPTATFPQACSGSGNVTWTSTGTTIN